MLRKTCGNVTSRYCSWTNRAVGIRIGDAQSGWVNYFVLLPGGDPRITKGNGAEFVAVDRQGNMYGGEPSTRKLQKYVRVRP